jgi:hypothetical protein
MSNFHVFGGCPMCTGPPQLYGHMSYGYMPYGYIPQASHGVIWLYMACIWPVYGYIWPIYGYIWPVYGLISNPNRTPMSNFRVFGGYGHARAPHRYMAICHMVICHMATSPRVIWLYMAIYGLYMAIYGPYMAIYGLYMV